MPENTGYVIRARISYPQFGAGSGSKGVNYLIETTYMQGKRMRSEVGDGIIIVDTARKRVLIISRKQREYAVTTFDELRKTAQQRRKALEERINALQAQLKNATPQQRQQMQRILFMFMLVNQRFRKVNVKVAGTSTVAGYKCQKYEVYGDNQLAAELWFCPRIKPALSGRELIDIVLTLTIMPACVKQIYDAVYDKAVGLPMKQVLYRPIRMARVVTKVEKRKLPEELFRAPKGFKKVPLNRVLSSF